jgi:hypothetical protein
MNEATVNLFSAFLFQGTWNKAARFISPTELIMLILK